MLPTSGNPVGAGAWRLLIGSGDPDVAVSVPALVASVPAPVAVLGRGWRHDFARMPGRSDGDADLGSGAGYADGEKDGAGCGEDLLLHLFVLLGTAPG